MITAVSYESPSRFASGPEGPFFELKQETRKKEKKITEGKRYFALMDIVSCFGCMIKYANGCSNLQISISGREQKFYHSPGDDTFVSLNLNWSSATRPAVSIKADKVKQLASEYLDE